MKKLLICLLFFAYTASLVKPVIPFFADTLAHAFWYSAHMATVHKADGAYHLQIDLRKAGTIPDHSHPGLPEGASRNLSEHLPSFLCWVFQPLVYYRHYAPTSSSVLCSCSIPQQGPPPKNASRV
ncbi:MAG TPA: hypothetical protein VG842_10110 [Sediminibacterium sp.]|nr:hypothetical protein [Sediminibacterium sp.]